jgi:hypothetical protein
LFIMTSRPSLPRFQPLSPLRSTVQSTLVATSLLLMLAWLGGWMFNLPQPMMLAAALAIVIIGFVAIGLRVATGDKASPMTPEQNAARGAGGRAAQSHMSVSEPDTLLDVSTSLQGKRWSLEVFANIDAQRFAAVCETWFSWAGFDTRHQAHRTQEGVDIWLHAPRLPGPVAIVRCKHAQDKPVGLQELREFQGVVSTCQHAHGTFTTTSTYTPEALQFAKENGIEVVDGRGLLRRILTRTRQSQQALLAVAYHGR